MSTSLPNSDCSSVVSDLNGYCYVVRLTPMERYSLEDLKKFLGEMDNHSWILAVETKPKLHYHCVIENDDDIDDFKKRIRSFLFQWWPDRPRGWGNAQYNCQICADKPRAISYALKDKGEYYYDGYSQEYIDWCILESFPKNSPSTFKVEYRSLCDEFQETDMQLDEFMSRFITLKAKYGQQVRVLDAYSYGISNMVKKDGAFADALVQDFLSSK